MASPSSERADLVTLERLAGGLLALMAGGALACVAAGLGLRWLGSGGSMEVGERLLSLATGVVVVAPLVSLSGVALRALRGRRRVGLFALGALVVTLLGMGLAR